MDRAHLARMYFLLIHARKMRALQRAPGQSMTPFSRFGSGFSVQ
jgi:hypothetical protein